MVNVRDLGSDAAHTAGASVLSAPTVAEIESFTQRLAADSGGLDAPQRIDRIAALESLRCATEAAQNETVADFVLSQRQAVAERGVPAERRDRGLAAQIALARRESPWRGQQQVALAMILRTELFLRASRKPAPSSAELSIRRCIVHSEPSFVPCDNGHHRRRRGRLLRAAGGCWTWRGATVTRPSSRARARSDSGSKLAGRRLNHPWKLIPVAALLNIVRRAADRDEIAASHSGANSSMAVPEPTTHNAKAHSAIASSASKRAFSAISSWSRHQVTSLA
jgi:hypothetical protein